ncbi:hypothetical protein E2C01_044973 [Portunus trituberculatus]|uniref:Uncharacterized protein n=1 Tax=Portunus trituberculatus TaxID=210409 RepID=A0A5B7G1K6_PORTR|nr:hypothetical protein [Portunus trituberculatus]
MVPLYHGASQKRQHWKHIKETRSRGGGGGGGGDGSGGGGGVRGVRGRGRVSRTLTPKTLCDTLLLLGIGVYLSAASNAEKASNPHSTRQISRNGDTQSIVNL